MRTRPSSTPGQDEPGGGRVRDGSQQSPRARPPSRPWAGRRSGAASRASRAGGRRSCRGLRPRPRPAQPARCRPHPGPRRATRWLSRTITSTPARVSARRTPSACRLPSRLVAPDELVRSSAAPGRSARAASATSSTCALAGDRLHAHVLPAGQAMLSRYVSRRLLGHRVPRGIAVGPGRGMTVGRHQAGPGPVAGQVVGCSCPVQLLHRVGSRSAGRTLAARTFGASASRGQVPAAHGLAPGQPVR